MKFPLGKICTTYEIHSLMTQDLSFRIFVTDSIIRHSLGDWGNICEEDKEENEFSLKNGFRLFSAYENGDRKIWIITEADRSATTVLFPHEY